MSIQNGGPAFPVADHHLVHRIGAEAVEGITDTAERDRVYIAATAQAGQGMTLRDYFAAKAMQGFCANQSTTDGAGGYKEVATFAYSMADAMLAAREVQS